MKDALVVEIGKYYLKIAVARFSLNKTLQNFYCIAKYKVTLNDVAFARCFIETLNSLKFFSPVKLKPSFLVLSLSRELVTVRILPLPASDPAEIAKMVDLHLVRVVPYKKEEVVYSYTVVDHNENGYAKILLCVIHKDVLKGQFKMLADAGLFIDKMYLASSGVKELVLNYYQAQIKKDTIYCAMNIDYGCTEIIAFSKDNLFFTRSIPIGAEQLAVEANKAKLINEIKQFLIVFRSEYEYKKPEKVIITGVTGELEKSQSEFGFMVDTPIEFLPISFVLNKVKEKKVDIPDNVSIAALPELLNEKSQFISFNLPETQMQKTFKEDTRRLVMAGSLIMYIFFLVYVLFSGCVYNRHTYLQKLRAYSQEIVHDVGGLLDKSEKVEQIKGVLRDRKQPLLLLQQLYSLVPGEIALKSLNVDEESVISLSGEAKNISDVFSFVSVLESVNFFKNIEVKSTRKKKTNEGELTDFDLTFRGGYEG